MAKCSATKRDGSPCTLPATYADGKCWAHSDATAENRRKGRSRGGRNRTGSGELVEVKREIRAVITDVLERNVERASGAVALQGYNILIRALEAERRVREQALIEERLDELEERLEQARREEGLHGGGYYGWGARPTLRPAEAQGRRGATPAAVARRHRAGRTGVPGRGWAAEIVAAAHHARERRSRGEPAPTPVNKMTGLQVCAEAVSYAGFAPPESVRLALRRLTHAEPDGHLGDDLTKEFDEATKAVLSLAFAAYAEETAG